jgi:hypothetical protein
MTMPAGARITSGHRSRGKGAPHTAGISAGRTMVRGVSATRAVTRPAGQPPEPGRGALTHTSDPRSRAKVRGTSSAGLGNTEWRLGTLRPPTRFVKGETAWHDDARRTLQTPAGIAPPAGTGCAAGCAGAGDPRGKPSRLMATLELGGGRGLPHFGQPPERVGWRCPLRFGIPAGIEWSVGA